MARTERAAFLAKVRDAVAAGARGDPTDGRPQESAGSSPAPRDLAETFTREAQAADCEVLRVASIREARDAIQALLDELGASRVVRGDTELLRALDLATDEAVVAAEADAGLTEADFGIAESGTLALLHRPGQARGISLLPLVHVAILRASDLVPDLGALFRKLESDDRHPASTLTFITGPSRTGDIEFVLTKGIHGPGEVHIVLLEDRESP
ncbi:MAG: LUD domain-containing protein [Myxococcota bacterium]